MSYEWLVIGGGPCGVMTMATLLRETGSSVTSSSSSMSNAKIAWIDPNFDDMGRMSTYGSVPANTRNDFLLNAFR